MICSGFVFTLGVSVALGACAVDPPIAVMTGTPAPATDDKADTVFLQSGYVLAIQGDEEVPLPIARPGTRRGVVVATLDQDTWDPALQTVTFASNALTFRPTPSQDLRAQDFTAKAESDTILYTSAFMLGVRRPSDDAIRWLSGSVNGQSTEFMASATVSPGSGRVSFRGFPPDDSAAYQGESFYLEDADPGSLSYVVLPVILFDLGDSEGTYDYTLSFARGAAPP
jgi:hypothetical protein